LKAKIDKLETNSKIKNMRDFYKSINDFKKRYQHRTNIVNDKKGDMFTDSYCGQADVTFLSATERTQG
jgi:hypothetical protein